MRAVAWLAALPLLPCISAKVIPIPRSRLLKDRDSWIDVTLSASPRTTLTPSNSWMSTTSTATSTTTAQSGSGSSSYQYIEPSDYNAEDYADDVLLFLQDELYTLLPDSGIEFDCPDNYFTMYFDESVAINGSLQEWGETFESGIMIIPNNWTSYCGDISDWTLYGYSDPDVVFSDNDEETQYYDTIRDPDVQYVVVVLHDLVEVNWLNRSMTFEAYADDFRAIIGALNTAPEEYDYFSPGPIANSTEDEIDFFNPDVKRRDLSGVHSLSKRAGVADLVKVVKILPTLSKLTPDVIKNAVTLVNQSFRISHINDLQTGSLKNQFTDQVVNIDLDLSALPQHPEWTGFSYRLYQFYYRGSYWVELWRTALPDGNTNNNNPGGPSSVPTTATTATTTTTTTTTSLSAPSPPFCSWSPNKEPLDKDSGTWWKQLFKIDVEKLSTTGEIPFPLKLLDLPGVVRAGKEARDAISSAQQVLKRFTILSSSTTSTTVGAAVTTTALALTSTTAVATTSATGDTALPTSTAAVATSQPTQALAARQDSETSFYDNCDVEILDWNIEFKFGNTSATVFPPTLSFHNYALKNRASIQVTCRDRFFETREASYFRIAAVPIGGCATNTELEVDAFFVLFLTSVFSSGSNGSLTIDFSYTWDPINFNLELLGGGPNDTIQLNATKLGIGPPSTSGFHFDYLRATASFPNIEMGFALSPAIQIDVVTPLLNYTRGLMLGPAVNLISNGTFSIGSGSASSGSSSSSGASLSLAATSTSSAQESGSTDTISDGSDFANSTDVVNLAGANNGTTSSSGGVLAGTDVDVLTGMSWGVLWTDYTYQKLGGRLGNRFKLPASKSKVGWLYGPFKFWSRDPS
ncbi:hypothetical protein A1O3_10283 [Capronia epimyces CBS 606.96]|uniref:Uncharacterized protein n=1 Tax=Capronia epimyces CBS 606.96 TaxID=1182542 RepID=W9XIE7_9EURO|nr:uncharacterized protein A1O3_10283 [Capronia epimyces CBS 606.96]EXJ77125.1 hypothetical protein A1O3_10283 [Capronia epimyces CBS 606.96]